MNLRQRWIDQLVKWCKAGQKAHAWHTAKELEKTEFGMLEGIASELEARMKSLNAQQKASGK